MTVRSSTRLSIALGALALLALAPAAAAQERTVSTSAEATLTVANDSAGIGLSVSRERRTRAAALQAASAGLRRVIGAAERVPGVGAGDVVSGRVSVRRVRRGRRATYRAGEGIAVTLHRPQRAGELIAAAVAAGASTVSGPRFFVGDTEAAFGKALAAAFEAAKTKAEVLAEQAGGTLGATISIDEGGGPELFSAAKGEAAVPVDACAGAASSARRSSASARGSTGSCPPAPPVEPGRSRVTATVHAVFELR